MTEDAWHVVLVPDRGHVVCSCAGVGWCSHIEATLVCGERAMVPREEWPEANRAQIAAKGRIGAPDGWQAHWRTNRRWRGLPPARPTVLDRSRRESRPIMSIEGRGGERPEIVRLSEEAGWIVAREPVKGCLFHVVPDPEASSRGIDRARSQGIPVASYDEWKGLAEQLGEVMAHEIRARSSTNQLQDEAERR